MKRSFLIGVLAVSFAALPLLTCNCWAMATESMHDKKPACCHPSDAGTTAAHSDEPCCADCVVPSTALPSSGKALISQGIEYALDVVALVAVHHDMPMPDLRVVTVIDPPRSDFLSTVFQTSYAPRAPPAA